MSDILLVEPAYKNKYPPIGLMKISTYHKEKGDYVRFVKGLSKEAISKMWDRIYITSMFTFHYNLTVSTIRYYKKAAHRVSDVYAGGILASLLPQKLAESTGVSNIVVGQLYSSAIIDYDDMTNIDELPLDYDILDDIDYRYQAGDNYFMYTTRGCPNKCPFCAVPKLEPEFKTTNNVCRHINETNNKFGEKRNLLLLDNNVLYSHDLFKIVSDIKTAGFVKTPSFIDPVPLPTFVRRLSAGINPEKNFKSVMDYLSSFRKRIKREDSLIQFDMIITQINESSLPEKTLIANIENLMTTINIFKNKAPKQRYVDFNQGIDARLLNQKRTKMLSELPIKPLRIAFDRLSQAKVYEKAVRLAYKYGFREISNYMLYNYHDQPEELWYRFKINVDLREELGINIFSFPMKYIPIFEINRAFLGKYWCKKYIRAVQSVLLVKHGIVSTNRSFFEKAFGRTIEEFLEILMMPEDFIIYRFHFEKEGLADEWLNLYRSLNSNERKLLITTIKSNKIQLLKDFNYTHSLKSILPYYEVEYSAEKSRGKTALSEQEIKHIGHGIQDERR